MTVIGQPKNKSVVFFPNRSSTNSPPVERWKLVGLHGKSEPVSGARDRRLRFRLRSTQTVWEGRNEVVLCLCSPPPTPDFVQEISACLIAQRDSDSFKTVEQNKMLKQLTYMWWSSKTRTTFLFAMLTVPLPKLFIWIPIFYRGKGLLSYYYRCLFKYTRIFMLFLIFRTNRY